MGVLPAPQADGHHHFIARLKEFLCLSRFDVQIVRIDGHGQTHFFHFDHFLVLAGFLFLFAEFEFEFAVIHDFAYGRICRRRNFNQIQIALFRKPQSGECAHNSELRAVRTDHSHFAIPNFSVDLILVFDNFLPSF